MPRRLSLLILNRAPINEKIGLAVRERKQVQNYLRPRARRVMKARPIVKIARSFALDSTLYAVVQTLAGKAWPFHLWKKESGYSSKSLDGYSIQAYRLWMEYPSRDLDEIEAFFKKFGVEKNQE